MMLHGFSGIGADAISGLNHRQNNLFLVVVYEPTWLVTRRVSRFHRTYACEGEKIRHNKRLAYLVCNFVAY
jgi:hypothetical protein